MKNNTPNNLLLLLCLCISIILFDEAGIFYLELNQLIYHNLSEQLTFDQLENYFDTKSRWGWVKYVFVPILLLLKTTLLSWILAIGGFLYNVNLPHKKYWEIVLKAEFLFLIPALVKIAWFLWVEPDYTLDEVQQFVPFSLQSILDTSRIPIWIIYPLQLINVFESCYWMMLIVLINQASPQNKGVSIVLSSYAPALFIWILFIMFLTLNLS